MMMKRVPTSHVVTLVFFMGTAVCTVVPTRADSASLEAELIDRMFDRLADIVQMKLDGRAKEAESGLLMAVADLTSAEKRLLLQENDSRKRLYELIGSAQSPTVPWEEVGRRRAATRLKF